MRALIVYYSRTGLTKQACDALAEELQAAGHEVVTEELIDKTDRGGILGFMRGGRDALLKRPTEIEPVQSDPTAFDLVVIGTPVWAATCAPAVRTFCAQFAGKLPRVAFVATMGGSGAVGAFKAMQACCGAVPVATLTLTDKAIRKGDAEKYRGKVRTFAAELAGG